MMKTPILILCGLFSLITVAFAQNNQPNPNGDPEENSPESGDQQGRNGFWEANMGGGNYVVALSRITSVSRHSYALDGAVIVDEVTVDTEGQAIARFYFIKPIEVGGTGAAAGAAAERVLDLVDGAARRNGVDVQDMVVKQYPLTTHSKTIEYRLFTEEQLSVLYRSVKTAWQTGRGRVFTAK